MIQGKKLFFRPVEEEDLETLRGWLNDPSISDLVVGWSFPVSRAEQQAWFQASLADRSTRRFVVESPEDGVVGLTGLWQIDWHDRRALTALKLGAAETRGRGLGTDAILTMMSYAFYEVGLNRLWSDILTHNTASYKAYVEKCGWRVEGVLRQQVYRHGGFHDCHRVAVLREDFERHPRFAEYAPEAPGGG